ncbi:MAG: nucleotidyltransferase substrate binding protein [Burkholderiales bacterium]|nr:nucleotidyltransferase substrate binding protein [Burkholderiales bacterium]
MNLDPLRNALLSLENGLDVVSDAEWFSHQSDKVQNTLIAGVIQNFEFVYEIGFKMLRRQIEAGAASPDEVDTFNFRDVLRVGAEKGLIADVQAWLGYRQMRNITAHTYDHEKARQVYQGTLLFLADARALLAALEARNG